MIVLFVWCGKNNKHGRIHMSVKTILVHSVELLMSLMMVD